MSKYTEGSKFKVDPVKRRSLKAYGLTPEAYDAILEAQNYVCKICNSPETSRNKGNFRSLAVDHDHFTGRIRGLLCNRCNVLLGFAKDNPTILLKALQYLKGNL